MISAQTRRLALTHNEESTLLHGLDVGGSQSNTDAVHLLVDNFILLHDVVYLVNGRGERSDSQWDDYAGIEYRRNRSFLIASSLAETLHST